MIALYVLSVMWFALSGALALALLRQSDTHSTERELWRAERQLLQGRVLRPAPSLRRPAGGGVKMSNERKMSELRRIANRPTQLDVTDERRAVIIPTDF